MNKEIIDIWKDLHRELKKFIFSKVRDEDVSNDILQDIFLKVILHIHNVRDSSKLTSWVFQITRNTVSNYFRETKLRDEMDISNLIKEESEEPLYQALSNCINSKINLLPTKYREAIFFTSFRNYSQQALASELKISYSGAKTRVQRAREKLKVLITDCPNLETDSQGNPTEFQTFSK